MPSLNELQTAMQSKDTAVATEAGRTLANYYYVYNQEYNALVIATQQANAELDNVTHNPAGVNTADALMLQSLVLANEARMKMLDVKMLAFHNSGLNITPPSQAIINKVKDLSGKVALIQVKANAVSQILGLLTQLAQLTTQVQGA